MKPDTQDYYSFLKFSLSVVSSLVGLGIREIEGSVRKNPAIENSVLYLFFK